MAERPDIDSIYETGRISLIAAIGSRDRALGKGGKLLWHIPDDLKRFKDLTTGHPVIMGRKTWESLPEKFRPLPDRTNIVVTRQTAYEARGALVAGSLDEARAAAARAPGANEVFIIGGGELYREALSRADRLHLTVIDDTKEADVFFPSYEGEFTKKLSDEAREWNGLHYRWVDLERK